MGNTFETLGSVSTSELVIDLDAIRANVEFLRAGTSAEVMAVVKADGYGHGLVRSARAALAGGATWLGVAQFDEALALRAAGVTAPVLAWLWAPDEGDAVGRVLRADIDVSVSSTWALDAIVSQARAAGVTARIHLKIDTGLSRNGSYVRDWPALVTAAAAGADDGHVEIVGIWSHFSHADEPGHPMIAHQLEAFEAALATAAALGVIPPYRHLANSAATLTLPESHYDLVRVGVAAYGLNPVPSRPVPQLRPAMTLRSHVALSKFVEAGEGVSYGHQYTTQSPGTLALIPLGYADGIPRHGSNVGPVSIDGWRGQVSGRVCMDQFVVDLGSHEIAEGAEVVIFGAGDNGEPTAQEWADAVDTIHYEIVTRIGARVPRRYVGPRELIQP
ncbi:MAG: alr [Pseudonocardiales bacterium]|nr:alr [Pseudonocardiales bacterium]